MKAFDDFHIETVAGYDEANYEALMQAVGIVNDHLTNCFRYEIQS